MPLARAIPRTIAMLLGLALVACAAPNAPFARSAAPVSDVTSGGTAQMPREIRSGVAEMAIQRVEESVSPDEVAAAITPLISNATICMRWPALWMERVQRNSFVVRYALMARDWGEGASAAAEARMEEFVAAGFLDKAPADALDPRAVEYTLTAAGHENLAGIVEPGRRPRFCAPAERQLVEITSMEWGEYPCGTLLVRFTHSADDWPSWARSDATRARLASTWPAIGEATPGTISLSRQWYRRDVVPSGYRNGSLRSLCYDASRQVVTGDDLNLSAPPLD